MSFLICCSCSTGKGYLYDGKPENGYCCCCGIKVLTDRKFAPEIQWWVAKLDKYNNPELYDGAHSSKEKCEETLYLLKRLGLKQSQKMTICKLEIYPALSKKHETNEEALNILNSIGLK